MTMTPMWYRLEQTVLIVLAMSATSVTPTTTFFALVVVHNCIACSQSSFNPNTATFRFSKSNNKITITTILLLLLLLLTVLLLLLLIKITTTTITIGF